MTKYSQSVVILPCHSMEDFPTHLRGKDAENLLACWTATWHPALLATTQKRPAWISVDGQELEFRNLLVIVPNICHLQFADSMQSTAAQLDSTIIAEELGRTQLIKSALQRSEAATAVNRNVDPELAKDFLALSYAYLQIQIMTHKLRYSSNLDQDEFFSCLLRAAELASQGIADQAKKQLASCFDLLQAEKNSYYPVQPELIDLVLTAPTTLGNSLNRQLDRQHCMNLLFSGDDARSLLKKNPAGTNRIREGIEAKKLSLMGGLQAELPDPLVSSETIVRQLADGAATMQAIFGAAPAVFARRSFGLTPVLPGLLDQFDFVGALHATFDDGKFPRGSASNIRWTGCDGESISAYGDLPLSAEDPATFLELGLKIGEAIDSAHLASFVLAHWPDRTSEFYEDLLRISDYGPLLGNFVTMEEYFEHIYDPGYGDTFTADEYQQPYLKQAVITRDAHPISRITTYWSLNFQLAACRALYCQVALLKHMTGNNDSTITTDADIDGELVQLEDRLDRSAIAGVAKDNGLPAAVEALASRLTSAWSRATSAVNQDSVKRFFVNTTHASRRVGRTTPNENPIALKSKGAVVFADSGKDKTSWVLEMPGMSGVSLAPVGSEADPFRKDPPVVEGLILRNESLAVEIDEKTGGIRSVQRYEARKNLLSQQLALRMPGHADSNSNRLTGARYTNMVADEIQTLAVSRIEAEITTCGRLVDGSKTLAGFQQTVRVRRGIRVFEIDLKIYPEIELSDSVNHYFCNRLAWKDPSAEIICNSQEMKSPVTSDWFLATNFVEIRQPNGSLTLLTAGLPYHRRTSRRMMDSVLIIGNEQQREFRLGIAPELSYPLIASQNWQTPLIETVAGSAGNDVAGWLFHFDCKNILVTWWQPLLDADRLTGVGIRFRETEGRPGKLNIRCCRNIERASRVNFSGEFLRAEEVDQSKDCLPVEFVAWDYFQIELNWEI